MKCLNENVNSGYLLLAMSGEKNSFENKIIVYSTTNIDFIPKLSLQLSNKESNLRFQLFLPSIRVMKSFT